MFEDDIRNQAVDEEIFGTHMFKLTLSLSAIAFLLLCEAHHYTSLNSPRQLYLTYLVSVITIDLLDSIYFLDLLWDEHPRTYMAIGDQDQSPEKLALELSILIFACINFVLPTFALLKLRYNAMARWLMLPYEKVYSLLYVLLVNVPYLAIRIYLWSEVELQSRNAGGGAKYDISVFIVKNGIMIYLAIRELWVRVQLYRQNKAANMNNSQDIGEQQGLTSGVVVAHIDDDEKGMM